MPTRCARRGRAGRPAAQVLVIAALVVVLAQPCCAECRDAGAAQGVTLLLRGVGGIMSKPRPIARTIRRRMLSAAGRCATAECSAPPATRMSTAPMACTGASLPARQCRAYPRNRAAIGAGRDAGQSRRCRSSPRHQWCRRSEHCGDYEADRSGGRPWITHYSGNYGWKCIMALTMVR